MACHSLQVVLSKLEHIADATSRRDKCQAPAVYIQGTLGDTRLRWPALVISPFITALAFSATKHLELLVRDSLCCGKGANRLKMRIAVARWQSNSLTRGKSWTGRKVSTPNIKLKAFVLIPRLLR